MILKEQFNLPWRVGEWDSNGHEPCNGEHWGWPILDSKGNEVTFIVGDGYNENDNESQEGKEVALFIIESVNGVIE